MKRLRKKNKYSFRTITLCLFCTLSISLSAQVERTKSVNKSFAKKANVELDHRYGPLTVEASQDGKIRLEANLSVQAQNDADAQLVLDHFDMGINEQGNRLELVTKFEVSTWNTNNNDTKLKFKDGKKVSNLRDLEISVVLYVPALEKLTLKNKYDDIKIGDNLTGDLSVVLYNGRVETGNIRGSLNADMKYSKGEFGNFADAELAIYDSDLDFGDGGAVKLSSKYSKLNLGNLKSIDMEVYDDKITVGNIAGNVTLIDKYSDITLGQFENARMDLYDSEVVMLEGKAIQLKSKYSSLTTTSVDNLHYELSYDDELEAANVGSIRADSKYTNFKIATLKTSFQLASYDDELVIGSITGPLKDCSFTGKYTDLNLDMADAIKYRLEANLTYGKLTYPEEEFDTQIYKQQHDKLEFKGKIKGATNESPFIQITSYDGKVVFK